MVYLTRSFSSHQTNSTLSSKSKRFFFCGFSHVFSQLYLLSEQKQCLVFIIPYSIIVFVVSGCNFFMNGQCLAAICLIGRSFAPKPRKPANSFTKRRLQTWQPFDGKNRRRDVLRPVYKTQVRVAEDGLNLKQSIVT